MLYIWYTSMMTKLVAVAPAAPASDWSWVILVTCSKAFWTPPARSTCSSEIGSKLKKKICNVFRMQVRARFCWGVCMKQWVQNSVLEDSNLAKDTLEFWLQRQPTSRQTENCSKSLFPAMVWQSSPCINSNESGSTHRRPTSEDPVFFACCRFAA